MMQKFNEYLEAVREAADVHPEWRVGQTYFNVLHRLHPKLSEIIRSGPLDTFYNDDHIPAFLAEVAEFLNQEEA